jgi:hypothetical protein
MLVSIEAGSTSSITELSQAATDPDGELEELPHPENVSSAAVRLLNAIVDTNF